MSSWLDALLGPQNIEIGGAAATQRPTLNLVPGANVTISAVDDPVRLRTDVTIASSGGGGGSEHTTLTGTISAGATWTATTTGVTCATSKTTYVEATFVVKRTSGVSAYFRRTVAIEYVSSAHQFVANAGTTISGNTIAEEASAAGFDARFVLTGPVLTFEAMAPAAGTFTVSYRKVELT